MIRVRFEAVMSLSHQLQTFRQEHRELLRALKQLDQLLGTLSLTRTDVAAVVQALENLQQLVEAHIRPHCAREKKRLSPVLRRRGWDREVQAMVAEDEALLKESRQLQQALAQVETHGTKQALEELVSTGERIITRLIEHIHWEDAFLFPQLEGVSQSCQMKK